METRRIDINFKLTKDDKIEFIDNAGRITKATVIDADNKAFNYKIYDSDNNVSYQIPLSEMNLLRKI